MGHEFEPLTIMPNGESLRILSNAGEHQRWSYQQLPGVKHHLQYSGWAQAVRNDTASALLMIKRIFPGSCFQSVEVAVKYTGEDARG